MDLKNEHLVGVNDSLGTFHVPVYDDASNFYDNLYDLLSYEDLATTNARIQTVVKNLHATNEAYKTADQYSVEAHTRFERAYRRFYLDLDEVKPDSARKMRASLKAEDYEDEFLYFEQKKKELAKIADGLRSELKALEILSNNYRRELQVS